ncbi:hypothetical protein L6452_32838 [Arctium lappa]|uniref:Uncharacterized protein n=1 Tax=Arctium lappa TaxID=4217 RepID=A0ACB8Z6L9_ARCLA|nr:hypothetical protein L6452_32838 [Arctium lappa]
MKRPREGDENGATAFEMSGYISFVNSGWFSEISQCGLEISVTCAFPCTTSSQVTQDKRLVCEVAEKTLLALTTWVSAIYYYQNCYHILRTAILRSGKGFNVFFS